MARENGFYWVKAHRDWPTVGYELTVARLADGEWFLPGNEEWVDENATHGFRVEIVMGPLVAPEV